MFFQYPIDSCIMWNWVRILVLAQERCWLGSKAKFVFYMSIVLDSTSEGLKLSTELLVDVREGNDNIHSLILWHVT